MSDEALPILLGIGAAGGRAGPQQSLPPPPPNPQQDTETNVQNMIVYQRALAEHAKRDEQIRMLGALVAKLAG